MAVFCYPVQPCLPLASFNLALDWTIFLLESVLLPVLLTTHRKTKSQISVHVSQKESEVSTVSNCKSMVPKLITILANYSDVFNGVGYFPGSP